MLKIKLKPDEGANAYFLPEGWDEISLEMLIKLKSIDFKNVPESNIYQMATIISTLMGCNIQEILDLDVDSYKILVDKTIWVKDYNVQPTVRARFELEGVKYVLLENFDKITIGEQASIEMFMMEDADKNIDKIIAVIVREEDENGNITPFNTNTLNKRAEVFRKNMKISDVEGISNFFLTGVEAHIKNSKGYSTQVLTIEKVRTE
jgi:hypothetical protein